MPVSCLRAEREILCYHHHQHQQFESLALTEAMGSPFMENTGSGGEAQWTGICQRRHSLPQTRKMPPSLSAIVRR